ncbi:MAG: DUF1461 domain-containing protein [Actinobacteria bacterium]|nr:DUF1461 domain-containing protein [Actinomycetota bacterium]
MPFARRAIIVALALAVPPALIATSLLVLAHPPTTTAAYALPGFPEPRIALDDDERSRLAAVGIRAIQPWQPDGIAQMRAARRDDGRHAFTGEEVRHFQDVRTLVLLFLLAGVAGIGVISLSAVLIGDRALVRRGLMAGARTTVALFAVVGAVMLVGFDAFFDGFHELFFTADTWKLPPLGTVRNLYPDALWVLLGGSLVVLVLAQAIAIELVLRRHAPRRRRRDRYPAESIGSVEP